jgi:hypothetical protein
VATVDELVDQALARALEFGDGFPSTRSLLYRRLGVRQQQLFATAARVNPEYFGTSTVRNVDPTGTVDLKTLGDPNAPNPVPAVETISRIEIADPGTSGLNPGTEINIVPLTDPDAAFPPRVTIRDGIIRQVGNELQGVTSIRIYYSRRPFRIGPTDGNREIELPEPFHELLVVDLARWMLRKQATIPTEVRQIALAALDAEEQEMLANFLASVKEITTPAERGRFGRTIGNTKQ